MTDELLVVRCQLGERDAFAELVRAWHEPVSSYVRRMVGRDADDVTQNVWLAALRGLPRLRQPDRFAAWLFTIARRQITNRLREEYARLEIATDAEPSPPGGGDDLSEAAVDRAQIVAGLAGLPIPEREILILFYLNDLSLDACAQICAIPVGTVKSRLYRARTMLRDELIRKGYER